MYYTRRAPNVILILSFYCDFWRRYGTALSQQRQRVLPVSLYDGCQAGVAGLLSWHSGWHRTHTETAKVKLEVKKRSENFKRRDWLRRAKDNTEGWEWREHWQEKQTSIKQRKIASRRGGEVVKRIRVPVIVLCPWRNCARLTIVLLCWS